MIANAVFSPLLILTVQGALNDKVASEYFAWGESFVQGVKARGETYVVVVDALDAESPVPGTRALIRARTICALTALRWLSRSAWRPARDLASGFSVAKELLTRAGMPVPSAAALAAYERPARAKAV